MRDILVNVRERVSRSADITEEEVKNIFSEKGFFDELGYDGFGKDIRSEKAITGGDRPDYFFRDDLGNVVCVIEFKKPSDEEDLEENIGQLWNRYMVPLKAKYGILTNGIEICLYERNIDRRIRVFRVGSDDLSDREESKLRQIEKPDRRWDTMGSVRSYLSNTEQVELSRRVDGELIGQNQFVENFSISPESLIHKVTKDTYKLLDRCIADEQGPEFVEDAYHFWRKYYAPEESDLSWNNLPDSWKIIAGSAANKFKVAFCVETVQSLLGRMMLAKACEDHEFPGISISSALAQEMPSFRDNLPAVSPLLTIRGILNSMKQELVESVFEQDIYYWWFTVAEPLDDLTPEELYQEDFPNEVESFSKSILELVLSLNSFVFDNLSGDPLGNLYQRCFSPEIRKALGEFYTPPPIADYILDQVDYSGAVRHKRIVDPSCGSGTFLISALERYETVLTEADSTAAALKDLCEKSRVVGFDIHPFAVVMAQIRFMMEILPYYKEAIDEEATFSLKRLPIYRTDSLINESKRMQGHQLSIYTDEGYIFFDMPLPIREGGDFKSIEVRLPTRQKLSELSSQHITEYQEYFSSMLAVFDAVKELGLENSVYEISATQLNDFVEGYFGSGPQSQAIADSLVDTANGFLSTVEVLREEYDDGRLTKLIEDVVLSISLKNNLKYDFVVGNPPWVSKHSRYEGRNREKWMKNTYITAWEETDTYMQFMEKSLQMMDVGGEMGLLVSNRFLKSEGGKEIRSLLAKNKVHEIIDFTDYPLFEDSTNYSLIVHAEKTTEDEDWESFISEGRVTYNYDISVKRVREWDESVEELANALGKEESPEDTVDFFTVDSQRITDCILTDKEKVVRSDRSEVYDGQEISRMLPISDVWCMGTPAEYSIIENMEEAASFRLGDDLIVQNNSREDLPSITDGEIHVGLQTSGDGVYIVHPESDIAPENLRRSDKIHITPSGYSGTYSIESELLNLNVTANHIDRWVPAWSGRLVLVPYQQSSGRASLINPIELENEYPEAWNYLSAPSILEALSDESIERKEIHARLAVKLDVIDAPDDESSEAYRELSLTHGDYEDLSEEIRSSAEQINEYSHTLWWYRFMRRQNIEAITKPKILAPDLVQENKLSIDRLGRISPHNVNVSSIIVPEGQSSFLAGLMNSSLMEFYHKQFSRIHQGKSYRYIKSYTSRWPIPNTEDRVKSIISDVAKRIIKIKQVQIKSDRFPDPYTQSEIDAGEEFFKIEFTPKHGSKIKTNVSKNLQGGFEIEFERDVRCKQRQFSKHKALYISRSLEGIKKEHGESVEIKCPRKDSVANKILKEYKKDLKILDRNSIEDMEKRIDNIVYSDLQIKDADKKIVKDYINQHVNCGSIG